MELWKEIIIGIMSDEPHLKVPEFEKIKDLFDNKCYEALEKIKRIIEDDSLDDAECFYKIEKIVCVFEALGSNGGNRHDFG